MAAQIKSNTIRIAQYLFYLNTVIWLVFGLVSVYRMTINRPEGTLTAWIVSLLVFGNAGAMLLSALLVVKPGRWGYLFALAVLAPNILLTFTDQFGAFDLITLLIDLILVALIVAGRTPLRHPSSK